MKEFYPVETVGYAVAQVIYHKPDFNWWVVHVLRKIDSIISDVKQRNTKYLKQTHKFGIEVPNTIA